MKTVISQCCDAPTKLMGNETKGSGYWYRCTKCNKDCNPKVIE